MTNNQKNVIIVEASSTGRYYASDLAKRGYHPVVLYPKLESENSKFEVFRDQAIAFLRDYTDDIIRLDSNDLETVLSIVRPFKPEAVIAGSEAGVYLTDALARALDLPGNDPKTSIARRDKYEMTQGLMRAGVAAIRSASVQTIEECLEKVHEWGTYPIVLKPLASAATVGVHFCDTEDEIIEKFAEIIEAQDIFGSTNHAVLVQEFARGTEFIVNTVSCKGKHAITDMWEYNKVPVGGFGNAYNYAKLVRTFEPRHLEVMHYALDVLDALGFEYGPSHTEIMLTDRGPLLIETGARPMGGYFPPEVLERALHHHIVDVSLDSYLDPERFGYFREMKYRTFGSVMLKLFIAPESVELTATPILTLKDYMASAGLSDFSLAKVGKVLPKTINLLTASGELILEANREADMMRDYRALRTLELEDFNLLFMGSPVVLAPATISINGNEHKALNASSWEGVITELGEVSKGCSFGDSLKIATSSDFAAKLTLLLSALGWDSSGDGLFRKR